MLTELLIGGATYFLTKKVAEKALMGSAELNNKISQMVDCYEAEQYSDAIELADEILASEEVAKLDEETISQIRWTTAMSYSMGADQLYDSDFLWTDDENEDAYNMLMRGRDLFFEYGNDCGWDDDVVFQIMIIDDQRGLVIKPRDFAIYLIGSENDIYRKKAIDIYNEDTECLLQSSDKFTDIFSYHERKYVYIGQNINKIGGAYQLIDDRRVIDWIFTLDQLPPDMVFPLGRPQSGLYMAHPVKTDHYYPMKGVEDTLFMEKVREFCWFVQCMGATKVSFHSNKGMSISKGMGSSTDVDAQVVTKSVSIAGSGGNTSKRGKAYSSSQQVELVQNFAPKKKAYCPDDLIWLDSDPAWQMLLKQRLEGGIMEYTYKISSSETCQISTSEMKAVKANFEYMMVKVNGDYNASTDKTFSSNKETEWSIHVEFAPIEELTEEPNQKQIMKNIDDFEKMDAGISLTEEQRKDYRTRANDPFSMKIGSVWQLENPPKPMALGRVWSGRINTTEDNRVVVVDAQGKRKYAEAIGVRILNEIYYDAEFGDACGIILDKVDIDDLEIGATIYLASEHDRTQSEITEAEQEYLDMVKECLEDGEIGNRERKLLDKIRVKNGISEERAKELESTLTVPQLTDDEKEYLEAYKDACEDGKVSDKQRRLLEKLRVMYGISEERAKLLENI